MDSKAVSVTDWKAKHMERKQIAGMLEEVMNERGVPRNVRESLNEAIKVLNARGGKESEKGRISGIISALDEAAGDPNLATYVRTQIWGIISLLEELKK